MDLISDAKTAKKAGNEEDFGWLQLISDDRNWLDDGQIAAKLLRDGWSRWLQM
jgi:hypothetical protein